MARSHPDLLGFGASDKPANLNEYMLEKQSKRIIALLNQFDNLFAQFDRYHISFRRLSVPVLIIWGKKDNVSDSAKLMPQFASDLSVPRDNIHIFEDANRFLPEDKADAISEKVKKFMGK